MSFFVKYASKRRSLLLFLGLIGAAISDCMVTNNCLLQINSQEHLLGRVMSVYVMTWALMPLGMLPAGAIADRMGVPFVLSLQREMAALVFLGAGLLSTRVWRLE